MNTEERKEMLCLETADSCVFERAYLVLRTGGETGCDVLNCEMVREAERIVAAARHSPLLATASAPPFPAPAPTRKKRLRPGRQRGFCSGFFTGAGISAFLCAAGALLYIFLT